MKAVITLCITILFLSNFSLSAQSSEDLQLARSIMQEPEKPDYSYHYQGETEILEFMKLLFTGYKALISSQDVQACNFHPSCSVYAMQAIRARGFFGGSIDAFDRMSRCHPLSLDHYEVHKESGLALDPVSTSKE
ncbi:membrane protein insertion efficiency factor YidD [Croceimicrobium hydrocarbonivorans]|nr:membrane protein insertion efficiency factor YidD [Croceimicrobium hydrocarbonivorans]